MNDLIVEETDKLKKLKAAKMFWKKCLRIILFFSEIVQEMILTKIGRELKYKGRFKSVFPTFKSSLGPGMSY